MKKRILMSLLTIVAVVGVVAGVTYSYFSDTETSKGNVLGAGIVDIKVDGQNPWTKTYSEALVDMKPSQVRWIKFEIRNVWDSNPIVVWKHLGNFVTDTGTQSEPECEAEGGYWERGECTDNQEKNNIHKVTTYDMEVSHNGDDWITLIDEAWEVKLSDVRSLWIPLGKIEPGESLYVKQSYHIQAEAGNEYQGDTLTFDIDLYAEQLLGSGPGPTDHGLVLENKTSDWQPIIDGRWGLLTYNSSGSTFDYDFKGFGLASSTEYNLIYYADPWPGNHPGALIGTFNTDASGNVSHSASVDLNMDLPGAADENYPDGAKIWLVPSSDYSTDHLTGWNPGSYLFESNLIKYNDLDV